MAPRLALIAGILLALLAAPASAHVDTRSELAYLDLAATVQAADDAAGAAPGGLPAAWCGTRTTADDVLHAAFAPALPQFKVVYAYPSDRPDRSAAWSNALQADVATVGRFMGAQSGGRKAPRFDMGTSCGPEYLDIQVVPLPGTRASYVGDFAALKAAVGAQVDLARPRNVVVLADTLSSQPVGYWQGLATIMLDDSPGAGNDSNAGGIYSALWVPDGEPVRESGWWPEGLLHEITHNLGAVQASAPHKSAYGHCSDGYDVMCYDDDGAGPFTTTNVCPRILGVMQQVYDCGNDDYFNVAPAAGSYLDTHWNVYENVFLATCASLAPACGETVTGVLKPPVATADPVVGGSARVGQTLTASRGTWVNAPLAYAYQWQRGSGDAWSVIAGATAATYTAGVADAGSRLRVIVVAVNGDGNASATSAATGVVAGEPAAVAQEPAPVAPAPPAAPAVVPAPVVIDLPGDVATEPAAPAVAPARGRATLRIATRRGRGKRLGTVAFVLAAGRLSARPSRVRLARGRYALKLCSTAAAPRCVRRRLTVKRARKLRLPVLRLRVPGAAPGRATYTVTAVRGRSFSARSAKRL